MKIVIGLIALLLTMSQASTSNSDPGQPEPTFDCEVMQDAHATLIAGCFSARRHFVASVNDKLYRRTLVRMDYAAGELHIETLKDEVYKSGMETDGNGDMALDVHFSCDRLTRIGSGRYELRSGVDPELVVFEYDQSNGVLLPSRWQFEETERFLFKKFHIQAHADYDDVSYSPCDSPAE